MFPRVRERERFVQDVLEAAINGQPQMAAELPEQVGGTLHLFSDGGSRGNPGQAAIAYILEDPVEGKVLKQHGETIGVETNNVAEYRALIDGLRAAKEFQPSRLICHLDSELVVKQLNGQYQVKMPTLKPFVEDIQEIVSELPDVIFTHIPREDNHRADALVNKALDALPRNRPQQNTFRQQPLKPPSWQPPRHLPPEHPSRF